MVDTNTVGRGEMSGRVGWLIKQRGGGFGEGPILGDERERSAFEILGVSEFQGVRRKLKLTMEPEQDPCTCF